MALRFRASARAAQSGVANEAAGVGPAPGVRAPLERPAPLREAAYDALVEMIATRELRPGQHLVENVLAVALAVSRQPVREALRRLQSEGWVDLVLL